MPRVFAMILCLLMSTVLDARKPAKIPVQIVLSGPRSAHIGAALPLHLKLRNISTDQQVKIVEGCFNHYLSWRIHADNGRSARVRDITLDCTGSEHVLEPGQEQDWAVDPSLDMTFSGPGNYFIKAIYTFAETGSLGRSDTPRSVESNTIMVSLR